jgi:hypothetical protein
MRDYPASQRAASLQTHTTSTANSRRTSVEPHPQDIRKVLRSLTARAAVLPAVVLADAEMSEVTAADEASGELLDRICTRRLRDLRNFVRRYRGALFTVHLVCRPVAAERVKALLGVPALYHSTGSAGRLHVCYPVAGAAPRQIVVPAQGEIYAWAGHTIDFRGSSRTREIVRDTLLVVTVRPEPLSTLPAPPARGSTPQLPLAL